jgi:hypothetical protein
LFEPGIQKDGGHQRLKGIGHRMAQIRLMAQVGSMRVNHKMLEAESIGQSGQVPVLDLKVQFSSFDLSQVQYFLTKADRNVASPPSSNSVNRKKR